jgi:deoxyribodipyrimidine photo-lyase
MDTAIVVFTRDLRLHDNPALHQACARARQMVPLFVADPAIAAPPNRARFLADSLADLRVSLRERGADLILRRGDPAAEVIRLAGAVHATAVYIADDVSHYATRRLKLERECARHRIELTLTPRADRGPAAHPAAPDREDRPPPREGDRLAGAGSRRGDGRPQAVRQLAAAPAGRLRREPRRPGRRRDLPAVRLPAVRLRVAARGRDRRPRPARRRGLLPSARLARLFLPGHGRVPGYRQEELPARRGLARGRRALDAWREGQTGIPIVDAGMRQLAAEGFMHNRARMVTASFLTRNLGIDWRHGLAHFDALLADADVANNAGNWQWVAGTGSNTRPNRVMNPLRQAQRFDRSGEYVRRYVPELAGLDPAWTRTPWKLPRPSGSGWVIRAR